MDLKTLFRLQWDRAAAWAFVGIGALVLVVGCTTGSTLGAIVRGETTVTDAVNRATPP